MADTPTPYILTFIKKDKNGLYTFSKDDLENDLRAKINQNLGYNARHTALVMAWIRERLLKKLIDYLRKLPKDGPPKLPTTPDGLMKAMVEVFIFAAKATLFLSAGNKEGNVGMNPYHPIYQRDEYLECLLFNYVWCGKTPARYASLARYFNDADRARIRQDLERQRENASFWERLVLPRPKR